MLLNRRIALSSDCAKDAVVEQGDASSVRFFDVLQHRPSTAAVRVLRQMCNSSRFRRPAHIPLDEPPPASLHHFPGEFLSNDVAAVRRIQDDGLLDLRVCRPERLLESLDIEVFQRYPLERSDGIVAFEVSNVVMRGTGIGHCSDSSHWQGHRGYGHEVWDEYPSAQQAFGYRSHMAASVPDCDPGGTRFPLRDAGVVAPWR